MEAQSSFFERGVSAVAGIEETAGYVLCERLSHTGL